MFTSEASAKYTPVSLPGPVRWGFLLPSNKQLPCQSSGSRFHEQAAGSVSFLPSQTMYSLPLVCSSDLACVVQGLGISARDVGGA